MITSFRWPDAEERRSIEPSFVAMLADSKSIVAQEIEAERQAGGELSAQDVEAIRSLSMSAPEWVTSNFWLSALWAGQILRHSHPVIFYGAPVAIALVGGAFLSLLFS